MSIYMEWFIMITTKIQKLVERGNKNLHNIDDKERSIVMYMCVCM
jgi:hypothetical protein